MNEPSYRAVCSGYILLQVKYAIGSFVRCFFFVCLFCENLVSQSGPEAQKNQRRRSIQVCKRTSLRGAAVASGKQIGRLVKHVQCNGDVGSTLRCGTQSSVSALNGEGTTRKRESVMAASPKLCVPRRGSPGGFRFGLVRARVISVSRKMETDGVTRRNELYKDGDHAGRDVWSLEPGVGV